MKDCGPHGGVRRDQLLPQAEAARKIVCRVGEHIPIDGRADIEARLCGETLIRPGGRRPGQQKNGQRRQAEQEKEETEELLQTVLFHIRTSETGIDERLERICSQRHQAKQEQQKRQCAAQRGSAASTQIKVRATGPRARTSGRFRARGPWQERRGACCTSCAACPSGFRRAECRDSRGTSRTGTCATCARRR